MSYDPSKTTFRIGGLTFNGQAITPRILIVELRLKTGSSIPDLIQSQIGVSLPIEFRNVPAYVAMDSMRRAIKNLTGTGEITAIRDDGTVLMDVSYDELEYY